MGDASGSTTTTATTGHTVLNSSCAWLSVASSGPITTSSDVLNHLHQPPPPAASTSRDDLCRCINPLIPRNRLRLLRLLSGASSLLKSVRNSNKHIISPHPLNNPVSFQVLRIQTTSDISRDCVRTITITRTPTGFLPPLCSMALVDFLSNNNHRGPGLIISIILEVDTDVTGTVAIILREVRVGLGRVVERHPDLIMVRLPTNPTKRERESKWERSDRERETSFAESEGVESGHRHGGKRTLTGFRIMGGECGSLGANGACWTGSSRRSRRRRQNSRKNQHRRSNLSLSPKRRGPPLCVFEFIPILRRTSRRARRLT